MYDFRHNNKPRMGELYLNNISRSFIISVIAATDCHIGIP